MAAESPQLINTGVSPNDGTGDPLRTAFDKVNQNLISLYNRGAPGSELNIASNEISVLADNMDLILTPSGTGHLVIRDERVVVEQKYTPASSVGVLGDVKGSFAWDENFAYVCVADYDGVSDIWRRITLPTTSW